MIERITYLILFADIIFIGWWFATGIFRKFLGLTNPIIFSPITNIMAIVIILIGIKTDNAITKTILYGAALPIGLIVSLLLSTLTEKTNKKLDNLIAEDNEKKYTEIINDPNTLDVVRSPYPAPIIKVSAEEGTYVNKGDTVLLLEAFKMEITILAPESGVVHLYGKEKQIMTKGEPLFSIGRC